MIVPQSLPHDFIPAADRPIRILFVCLGNICRSPAAEGILRDIIASGHSESLFEVDSAGTGRYHIGQLPDSRMRIHATRRGIDLTHRCRHITSADFEYFDLIIGMDASNISDLQDLAPSPEGARKIVCMASWFGSHSHYDHVPDPYYEGAEGFELVLDLLTDGCLNLHDTLVDVLSKHS